jgi:putative restriction endonuclease
LIVAKSAFDLDWRIRQAAFEALRTLCAREGGVVSSRAIAEGFAFEGERIAFRNPQKGIWRPRQLGDGPALSIVTISPRAGKVAPYDDQIASATDHFEYRYEGTDPNYWTNAALRLAYTLQRPIIYFYAVAPAIYDPIFPCYVVGDDPARLTFLIMADRESIQPVDIQSAPILMPRRAYTTATVKVRLHQKKFSHLVISAYGTRCTVCRLARRELLDAAHIIEDRDERGRPEVPNGLALCRIHHAAYDADILGVDPDHLIHIRHDILEERDGPMLKHGLQEMHGERIRIPGRDDLKPNRDYLDIRFKRFLAA